MSARGVAPEESARWELRLLFQAFAALAFGAFLLLFVLSDETDDWFAWTIQPPMTAAFLGASYFAALVLFVWTARRGGWGAAQATLVPVAVIAVMLLVATIIHEDRFHDDLFGWFWKLAYVVAPLAILAALARSLRRPRGPARPRASLPVVLRTVLPVQGGAMLALGIYLFLAPGSADALWPWDLTPLTARAIGAFLTGFGVSAIHALLANDLRGFEGAALAYATLGGLQLLALVLHSGDLTGGDADSWLYVAVLTSVLVTGLYGWWSARGLNATA